MLISMLSNLNKSLMNLKLKISTSSIIIALLVSLANTNTIEGQNIAQNASKSTVEITPLSFEYVDIEGIGYEKGCTRRDPSDVILVDNTYYVYYTKVYGRSPGYWGTIWCASSSDGGYTWKEEGEVLGVGETGRFDHQATFTPNIIKADDNFYMFYTGVKPTPGRTNGLFENNSSNDFTAIGLAKSAIPNGKFKRVQMDLILTVSDVPEDFDRYRVDDAALLFRDGMYWLYYKGRSMMHGEKGPLSTKMGVALSRAIEGPYQKHGPPILDKSHEVLIWPLHDGVAALASFSSTLEYAPDGIDFLSERKMIKVENRPPAPGAYRPELTQMPHASDGINWGISMIHNGNESYLIRFNIK
jgi:hypothetical protein